MEEKKKSIAIYCRSTKRGVDLSNEIIDLIIAAREQYPGVGVFVFRDKGKKSDSSNRPGLNKLVFAVMNGYVLAVFVSDMTRVSRGQYYLQMFNRLCSEAGVKVIAVNMSGENKNKDIQ